MKVDAVPVPGYQPAKRLAWLVILPALLLSLPAFGQEEEEEEDGQQVLPVDQCAANPCRELSRDERAAFGRLLTKMMEAVPAPDRLRYKQTALKTNQGLGQSIVTDEMRQSSDFPANLVDPMGLAYGTGSFPRSLSVAWLYNRADRGGERPHATGSGEMEIFDARVQVSAFAAPVRCEGLTKGRTLESKGIVLMWERPLPPEEAGMSLVSLVVGQRSETRGTAATGAPPPEALAGLKAVQVDIFAPKGEALAIAKKVDTRTLTELLAPEARKPGAGRKKGAK